LTATTHNEARVRMLWYRTNAQPKKEPADAKHNRPKNATSHSGPFQRAPQKPKI